MNRRRALSLCRCAAAATIAAFEVPGDGARAARAAQVPGTAMPASGGAAEASPAPPPPFVPPGATPVTPIPSAPAPAPVPAIPAGPAPTTTATTATELTVTAVQPVLTLGVDSGTSLQVTVVGPLAAQARPGRTQATVGEIGPLVPQSTPGSFVAEYRVPLERVPQSAIISVEVTLPGGARAHATTHLSLPAATAFPLRSSPNADVSLEIEGLVFGPLPADADGNVNIPIVVPPYVATGRARAVNKFGIVKETDVDLQARDYPRVLLIAPPEAEAGATITVEAWAIEPSGEPAAPENIDLRASSGGVRRVGGMPGVARFAYTLPALVGAGAAGLTAATADGSSTKSDFVIIHAGVARDLLISSRPPRLIVGSDAGVVLTVGARDRFGNVVAVDGVTVTADGQPLSLRLTSAEASVVLPAPARWEGRAHLTIEARLNEVRAARDLLVTGGDPARLELTAINPRVEGNDTNGVELVLAVFDTRGTPTAANKVVWQTDDEGWLETVPSRQFGTYLVRFVPRRTMRDRAAFVGVTVDSRLVARSPVVVEAGATRTAAVRVGLLSNLGDSFGQFAFVEASAPLLGSRFGRFGRLFTGGLAVGYLHTEASALPTMRQFPSVHLNVNQIPILAHGHVKIPAQLPVELSLVALAGVTFASTTVVPNPESLVMPARGSARAWVLGFGADASFLLQPGELVIGARYMRAHLGRNSNGDQIQGNVLGFLCDVGFRMGF